jgi:hypothetical protein
MGIPIRSDLVKKAGQNRSYSGDSLCRCLIRKKIRLAEEKADSRDRP